MNDYEVIVKALEPIRVVTLTEDLAEQSEIGEACGRMYPLLHSALERAGAPFGSLSLALYEDTENDQRPLRLTTALPIPGGVTIDVDRLTTVDLPAVDRAATSVVRGAPDKFPDAFRGIHEWIEGTGDRASSFARELYIDCDGPHDTWVTELQVLLEPKP